VCVYQVYVSGVCMECMRSVYGACGVYVCVYVVYKYAISVWCVCMCVCGVSVWSMWCVCGISVCDVCVYIKCM